MPDPKRLPPVEAHLAQSRRLLAEMDALLKRVQTVLLGRPRLVARPRRKDDDGKEEHQGP